MPPKIMNNEIKKYQDRIYFLHDNGRLEKVDNVFSTADYCHYRYEMHHVIKYTQYEANKPWYESEGLKMCLVIMARQAHQHLEDPIYSLGDEDFFRKYHIQRSELLFERKKYNSVGYKVSRVLSESFDDELFYDGCFDCLDVAEVTANV